MTEINFRPAALAALAALAVAAGLAAGPAFAQGWVAQGDAAPAEARVVDAQPVVEPELVAVPPNAMGHFTCAFNEAHTRLERKNCGGTHYRSGF